MDSKLPRLSKKERDEIAQNLIDILQKNAEMTEQTENFISNWIFSASDEKRKAYFDVWDVVLKNYMPATRPVLFRACQRLSKDGKIASFTARLESAKRFSNGCGSLIVCDTRETLQFEEQNYQAGQYKHTFYPLVEVLKKGQCSRKSTKRHWHKYIGEDEYIMRINLEDMCSLKWRKKNI